ncbi:MAG: hypothetical protein LRY27_03280 [Chitinophagales bacterium]|nr:hypothetical protein [Chitinophagales bacterium]
MLKISSILCTKKLQNIKNILFDLGEVLIDLDFSKTELAFLQLLGIPKEQLYSYKSQTALFDNLETGKITPKHFRDSIKQLSQLRISDAQIDHAWNAMLLQFPLKKYNLVQNLRLSYKCFCFE